jgi:hypothetical protein
MGPDGSKVRAFDEFHASVEPLEQKIIKAQGFAPAEMPHILRSWSRIM